MLRTERWPYGGRGPGYHQRNAARSRQTGPFYLEQHLPYAVKVAMHVSYRHGGFKWQRGLSGQRDRFELPEQLCGVPVIKSIYYRECLRHCFKHGFCCTNPVS